MSNEYFAIASLGVLGRLELALGNLKAAGGYLRELPVRLIALGIKDPAVPVWADAIETLIALGELDRPAPTSSITRSMRGNSEARGPWPQRRAVVGSFAAAEGDLAGGSRRLRARPGRVGRA